MHRLIAVLVEGEIDLGYGESKITKHCVITKEMIYRKAHKTKKN